MAGRLAWRVSLVVMLAAVTFLVTVVVTSAAVVDQGGRVRLVDASTSTTANRNGNIGPLNLKLGVLP